MAKHDDIIGKKLLEVEEKPERLTLIFEDNWYLIIYKKDGKLYAERVHAKINELIFLIVGLLAGMFLTIISSILIIYLIAKPEIPLEPVFSPLGHAIAQTFGKEGYSLSTLAIFVFFLLMGIFVLIISAKSILDKYMKRRSLTSNKDNKL
ncbi:MAG: hypothetical protein RQ968_06435 [Thermoproteota archaeon]|jgi:hypothetical protein|nr:hypothetical protein [Thermoproteota archaeon]